MDGQGRTRSGEGFQLFALGHCGRLHGRAGQDNGLTDVGKRQFRFQGGRRSRKSRHAGRDAVVNAGGFQAPDLFGDGPVERGIAGMDPGHILAGIVGGSDFRENLFQGHGRRIAHQRIRRCEGNDLLRHQGAGIKQNRAAGNQVPSPDGDEVRCSGTGPDEMHRHGLSPFAA